MVSEIVLGQTQTTPQDHFFQASKTYTKSTIEILIRYSFRDSTEQTNPEKYNRHTQQIMNLATQLAVKELLKSKCLVQFTNTSVKQYLIQNFSSHSPREGTITMIALQCTELPFLSYNYPSFSQHEQHVYCW